MANVVLFHHALGLTPGVVSFADQLRAAGHHVHTPDLFEGRTFETIPDGVGHAGEIGFGEVIERGVRSANDLGTDLVYTGMSLGVLPAQKLAQTREGARGALLLYSAIPVSEFGDSWPDGVPVQIHAHAQDEFFLEDEEAARDLVSQAADGELFLYPGDTHYFADATVADFDATAAGLLLERVLAFLDRIG